MVTCEHHLPVPTLTGVAQIVDSYQKGWQAKRRPLDYQQKSPAANDGAGHAEGTRLILSPDGGAQFPIAAASVVRRKAPVGVQYLLSFNRRSLSFSYYGCRSSKP